MPLNKETNQQRKSFLQFYIHPLKIRVGSRVRQKTP